MDKPRILVTTASGKTGMPVVNQLLQAGFPVTAFVFREDARSEQLKAAGADIVVGSLMNVNDMRHAMTGAQRVYFNTPPADGTLTAAATFAAVANEQRLDAAVVMSQWLANPIHPSAHTREHWLADRFINLLPHTDVTTINVGFFADNDLQTLPYAVQFGRLFLPYGQGRNAPPSNEDIAAVIATILMNPEGHAGKTYRPTGPDLLSGEDLAFILSSILGRHIRYVNAPLWLVRKLMKGMGFSSYVIAQTSEYYLEYQQGTFAVGGPTDVVRRITGRDPEDFATIARRYVATLPSANPSLTTQLRFTAQMLRWLLRPLPGDLPPISSSRRSRQQGILLSMHSPEWQNDHVFSETIN